MDGEPVIDINDFLPADFGDIDGDNVPDLFEDINDDGIPDIPEGIHGIWDDTIGAKTEEEFIAEVDVPETFDFDDELSLMMGPCGGLVHLIQFCARVHRCRGRPRRRFPVGGRDHE